MSPPLFSQWMEKKDNLNRKNKTGISPDSEVVTEIWGGLRTGRCTLRTDGRREMIPLQKKTFQQLLIKLFENRNFEKKQCLKNRKK